MREKETQDVTRNFFGSLEIELELARAENSVNPRKFLQELAVELNDVFIDVDDPKFVLAHGAFLVRYANNKYGFEPYETTYGRLSGFRVALDSKTPYLVADIIPSNNGEMSDEEDTAVLLALLISTNVGLDNYSIAFDTGSELLQAKIDEWRQVIKTAMLSSANIFDALHETLVYDVFINEVRFMSIDSGVETVQDLSHKALSDSMTFDIPAIEFILSSYLDVEEPAMSVVCKRSYESEHTYMSTPPEIFFKQTEGTHCIEGTFVGVTIEPIEKNIGGLVMVRPRPLLVMSSYETGNLVQVPFGAILEYNFAARASHDDLIPSQRASLGTIEAIASELDDIDTTSGD